MNHSLWEFSQFTIHGSAIFILFFIKKIVLGAGVQLFLNCSGVKHICDLGGQGLKKAEPTPFNGTTLRKSRSVTI